MNEEVSVGLKIGILLVLIGAFMSSVVMILFNTNALLKTTQDSSVEAVDAVGTQNIVRLQNDYRRYVDIYKTYEYFEEKINSIYGVELDGTQHILYLRNADWVCDSSPLYQVCVDNSIEGIQNIDVMYRDFLNQYCDEEHSSDWLRVYIYPDKLQQGYDIYYEVVDR